MVPVVVLLRLSGVDLDCDEVGGAVLALAVCLIGVGGRGRCAVRRSVRSSPDKHHNQKTCVCFMRIKA